MAERARIPEATVYRLSLYHCFLGDLIRSEAGEQTITSRQLADRLGLREETVRRDISFVGEIGRPGLGYVPADLFAAFTDFLGLSAEYPVVRVGSAQMLGALEAIFPASAHGLRAVACYSDIESDAGAMVGDVEVRPLAEARSLNEGRAKPVRIALVACAEAGIQAALDSLAAAGVTGVLMLTPTLGFVRPDGMTVRQLRMPCDIKTLACACKLPVAAE